MWPPRVKIRITAADSVGPMRKPAWVTPAAAAKATEGKGVTPPDRSDLVGEERPSTGAMEGIAQNRPMVRSHAAAQLTAPP